MTGKKGWNHDERTDEWYYTSFLNFQPDLNYDNPEVRKEMFDIVRFWLNEGIDGFRLDIFNCIGKELTFENNPFSFRYLPTPSHNEQAYFQKILYESTEIFFHDELPPNTIKLCHKRSRLSISPYQIPKSTRHLISQSRSLR